MVPTAPVQVNLSCCQVRLVAQARFSLTGRGMSDRHRNPRNPSDRDSESEREMAERLFSSNPITFKMDRNSDEASDLRDAIKAKLFEFLGDYTDEVLAEYIMVLVSNGKNQTQARDDLEDFLGEDNGRFVAWLWDHLSRRNYISKTTLDSSSTKATITVNHENILNISGIPSDIHTCTHSAEMTDISVLEGGRYYPPHHSTNSNCSKVPESLRRWCPSVIATKTSNENLHARMGEVNGERLQTKPTALDNCSARSHYGGSVKHFSSIARSSPEVVSGDEQLHYEYQPPKIARTNSSAMLHGHLPAGPVPREEQFARGLRSLITEDHHPRPLPMNGSARIRLQSENLDPLSHKGARRGNVWDRLGKPCTEGSAVMRVKHSMHGSNNLFKRELQDSGEEDWNDKPMRFKQDARLGRKSIEESVALDTSCDKVACNNHIDEHGKLEVSFSTPTNVALVNNSKRKRLHSMSDASNSSASFTAHNENYLRVKETLQKKQGSFPVKYNRSQSLNEVASEAKLSTRLLFESACDPIVHASVDRDPQANKADEVLSVSVQRNSQTDKVSFCKFNLSSPVTPVTQKLVPNTILVPAKSDSLSKAESGNANHRPVKEEVLDVKSRLRQIEMDMLKLRSKQAAIKNDVKVNALTGVQNQSEEDIESRTVLVTNVHFAASREALLSHFTKCGAVVKVVMLTDTITAQPKGAAYIVFANKDSVEKALYMSGTSFFSRILTVMRKADMPSDFLVPPQKLIQQPLHPQSCWTASSAQRKHSSTHLQWRRDAANGENPVSATTTTAANQLESSTSG